MIVISDEFVTLDTPDGPMRTHIVRCAAPGRYPGIVFHSEIFQITAPVRRTAAFIAGHGYKVAMPEIFHEFETAGTVFALRPSWFGSGQCAQDHQEAGQLRRRRQRCDEPGPARCRLLLRHRHPQGRPRRGHARRLARARQRHPRRTAHDLGRQDPHIPLEGRMNLLAPSTSSTCASTATR